VPEDENHGNDISRSGSQKDLKNAMLSDRMVRKVLGMLAVNMKV
jgi:hypothetical protein